ncbi:hypothetical protein [Flavobacterium sp. 5]|uniref:hypothetical protein n=1 Tax=Flavobacterium sp. 5 TaxID=2035199 RepID=UPI000C2B77AC|nr:hypothetical protein [Flavobacterium sp. 5]PKB17015.1 hypothetical protein CLU82_2180 [Flavobacterium sp. 5]
MDLNFFKKIRLPNIKIININRNKNSKITLVENQTIIEKRIILKDELISALRNQNEAQLDAQINSGKYLKNTFLEVGNQKDYLRYSCSPIFYLDKIFDVIEVLDFRYLNLILEKKSEPPFSLEIEHFLKEKENLEINNSLDFFNRLHQHLESKKDFIGNHLRLGNIRSQFESKIRDLVDDLIYFKSKVILIIEMAGQGKTNFLCDFVENFLLKKNVLTVFLTGIEIKSDDIRQSIIKRIFPDDDNITFLDILDVAEEICKEKNEYFVIIIDGINENYNTKIFSTSLELFISDMQKYEFVKIVLSCRSEYYKDNFINLENSKFSNTLTIIDSLMERNLDGKILDKFFNNYIDHFNINYQHINKGVKGQLLSNFLLFRIFCETYENSDLDIIDNIYKEELFNNYYTKKTAEINNRLNNSNGSSLIGSFDIRNFIKKVVKRMIEKKQYTNIVLDEILDSRDDKELYVRFLDENILIKRDLIDYGNSIFGSSEVVNFTFDEFRDFLISDFLIHDVYVNSKKEFTDFLLNEVKKDSPLMEGCSTFLFYKSRKSTNSDLKSAISAQIWFKNVFAKCIFNVNDEDISVEDKDTLKEMLFDASIPKKKIIMNLINNGNVKNLNIDFLFDSLLEMNEDEYRLNFSENFGTSNYRYDKIDQDDILSFLTEKLYSGWVNNENRHKLFELLIYMFLNDRSYSVKELFEKYYFKNVEIATLKLRKIMNAKNEVLKNEITKFIERYGISL